jgi:hypothetical protein
LKGILSQVNSLVKYEQADDEHPSQTPNWKRARQIEATLIFHLDFTMKQDQALAKAFLKLVKEEAAPFTPFNIAILLCMSRIKRFEDKVLFSFSFFLSFFGSNWKKQTNKIRSTNS